MNHPQIESLPKPNCYVTHWHRESDRTGYCGVCGRAIAEKEEISTITMEWRHATVRVKAHTSCVKERCSEGPLERKDKRDAKA